MPSYSNIHKRQWHKDMRSSGICHYCGERFPKKEMTVDHKQPLAKGGKNNKENCCPCCITCNREKGSMTYNQYMKYLKQKKAIVIELPATPEVKQKKRRTLYQPRFATVSNRTLIRPNDMLVYSTYP